MSLINQMLHDLDNRRLRAETRPAGYVVAGLHSPSSAYASASSMAFRETRLSMSTSILLLSLGILLAAVAWRYMSLVTDEENTLSSANQSGNLIIGAQPFEDTPHQAIQLASLPPSFNDGQPETTQSSQNAAPLVEHTGVPDSINKSEPVRSETPFASATVNQPKQLTGSALATHKTEVIEIRKKFRPLSSEQIAEAAYRTGLENIQRGKVSTGMQELQNVLLTYEGHIKAREILAGLLIKSGQSAEAGELLNKGIELHPGNSQFVKLYSRILLEQGQRETALQVLEANKPALDNDPEYYAILAAIYQQLNQHHHAANIYNQLVTIAPGSGVFWMGLGISLEADGKPEKAIQAYERAKLSGTLDSGLMRFINGKISSLGNV